MYTLYLYYKEVSKKICYKLYIIKVACKFIKLIFRLAPHKFKIDLYINFEKL
jgi:hypothetical protein